MRRTRNVGASVRARLLDRARAERSDFQILLTRYALERLLYRLSVSEYRDRFILKGALLFVVWVRDPFRPTRDLDLLGFGDSSAEPIAEAFRVICAQPVADDGVVFDITALNAAPIREELEYGGVRVRTTAVIASARIPIQIDIGFGDAITPAPLEIDYPTMLDSPTPHLRAYPVETVIAEKFEALTTLGIANSRLKDFYDLWQIAQSFGFQQPRLLAAVQRTFEQRGATLPVALPVGLSDDFVITWSAQWRAFLGRERMATAPEALGSVVADLRKFLMPLIDAPESDRVWPPGGPWSAKAVSGGA